ncbi:MAG: SLC13 family permease [Planctomycetota bacterium]|nr:SLC13 family permease [Planctomycetota bacterium]
MHPLVIMSIGMALVIGMIMWLRINAFISLITAAIVVSLMVPNESGSIAADAISRVATAFGNGCGSIGIVIALAAVIGTCMMDSGAADRIVRSFMNVLGEKRSPWALMGSGYVLAVPVFFDTVFYLLVPLARSFYRRTGKNYLKCILAITAGGAITHTLVPPTPGPLTMAATLGIDMGVMILVGAMVALPAAIAGIMFAGFLDGKLSIPLREIAGHTEPEPLADDKLPGLFISLLPVVLPVAMIAINTATNTVAQSELRTVMEQRAKLAGVTLDTQSKQTMDAAKAKGEKMTRSDALKEIGKQTVAESGSPGAFSDAQQYTEVIGNPNLALLISVAIALFVFVQQRGPSKEEVSKIVEASLMSGGVIILITAGGMAFGAMLKVAKVGDAISDMFVGQDEAGMAMLFLGFGIAALLKVAQGSSTAAMIITSSMMADMVVGAELPFNKVYVATAIGAGSLIGSWMNDSGFWVFSKMGGLTEAEGLKTWTPLLMVLGAVSMTVTVILANILPMAG